MYKIPLKKKNLQTVVSSDPKKPVPISWGAVLKDMSQFTDQNGFSPNEMRISIAILQKLDENAKKKYILFEDKEYEFLKSRFQKGFRFNFADVTLVEFCDDFDNAEKVDISDLDLKPKKTRKSN